MALRFTTPPPTKAVVWKCPSCTAENTGPLEQGCTSCHAGDPKQSGKVQVDPVPPVVLPNPTTSPSTEAFLHWVATADLTEDPVLAARSGWEAALTWVRQAAGHGKPLAPTLPENDTPPEGGWRLALAPPYTFEDGQLQMPSPVPPLDAPTQATIVAALAFYLDNQLAYGAIPGQLSAAECQALIEKLKEPEEVPHA